MGALPYPHRATFLASTLTVPAGQEALAPYVARLVFDHLVRHPVRPRTISRPAGSTR